MREGQLATAWLRNPRIFTYLDVWGVAERNRSSASSLPSRLKKPIVLADPSLVYSCGVAPGLAHAHTVHEARRAPYPEVGASWSPIESHGK